MFDTKYIKNPVNIGEHTNFIEFFDPWIDKTYRNPGDGEPALPEHDCDTDWWLCIWIDDDCGRSKSESVRGLWAGALVLKRSSSLSPIISGDESRLRSFCIRIFNMIYNWSGFKFEFRHWKYLHDHSTSAYYHHCHASVALPLNVRLCAIWPGDFETKPNST